MKNLVLVVALVLTASSAFAARRSAHNPVKTQNLDPLEFVGNYSLVHESLGMCEIEMNVGRYDTYADQLDLTAGSAFFQNINGGVTVRNDKWSSSRTNSYVTGRTMVQTETSYDKLLKQTERRTYSITLSANHKYMTYKSTGSYASIPFLCTYKYSPLPDPDQVQTDVNKSGQ